MFLIPLSASKKAEGFRKQLPINCFGSGTLRNLARMDSNFSNVFILS